MKTNVNETLPNDTLPFELDIPPMMSVQKEPAWPFPKIVQDAISTEEYEHRSDHGDIVTLRYPTHTLTTIERIPVPPFPTHTTEDQRYALVVEYDSSLLAAGVCYEKLVDVITGDDIWFATVRIPVLYSIDESDTEILHLHPETPFVWVTFRVVRWLNFLDPSTQSAINQFFAQYPHLPRPTNRLSRNLNMLREIERTKGAEELARISTQALLLTLAELFQLPEPWSSEPGARWGEHV